MNFQPPSTPMIVSKSDEIVEMKDAESLINLVKFPENWSRGIPALHQNNYSTNRTPSTADTFMRFRSSMLLHPEYLSDLDSCDFLLIETPSKGYREF